MMIRDHLDVEKPPESTNQKRGRGGATSGGVLGGVLGVSEHTGQGFFGWG